MDNSTQRLLYTAIGLPIGENMDNSTQRLLYTAIGLLIGAALGYYLGSRRKSKDEIPDLYHGPENLVPLGDGSDSETLTSRTWRNVAKHIAASDKNLSFLTGIVSQLWDYIAPAISKLIRDELEPILLQLAGVKILNIDLGQTPLRLDHVLVRQISRQEYDFVKVDLDVLWDSELSLEFQSSVGKFGIKSLKFKGRLSLLLKPLTPQLPCIGAVSYTFINQPELGMRFTGLASVAEFSFAQNRIKQVLHDVLAGLIVLPHRKFFKLDDSTSFIDIYQPAHAIIRFTLESGRNFQIKRTMRMDNLPDVYCMISLGNTTIRTPTIQNCLRPVWNYSMDFLAFDYDQSFTLDAWDEDNEILDSDDDLGVAHVTIRELLLTKDRRIEVALRDRYTDEVMGTYVTVKCDMWPLMSVVNPVIPESLPDHMLTGVLAILVKQAFHIPVQPLLEAVTFVKVAAGEEKFETGGIKPGPGVDFVNPSYDCVFHVPITVQRPDVSLALMHGEDVLGTTTVKFNELLKTPVIHRRQDIGYRGAKLEFCLRLSTADAKIGAGDASAASARGVRPTYSSVTKYSTGQGNIEESFSVPICKKKVQLTVVRGVGFKIRRRFLRKDDIPDVYIKIRFGDSAVWQTSAIANNTKPVWQESKIFEFFNTSEVVVLEAWDRNKGKFDKDFFYGSALVSIEKILLDGGTTVLAIISDGKKTRKVITLSAALLD